MTSHRARALFLRYTCIRDGINVGLTSGLPMLNLVLSREKIPLFKWNDEAARRLSAHATQKRESTPTFGA